MTIETTVRINRSGRSSVLWSLVFCALPAMAPAQTPDLRSEHIHALLINGGDRPASNYLSHLHHLEEMFDVLRDRGVRPEHIDVFSADGDDPLPDTARRDLPPADFWLLEGSVLGNRLKPAAELTDTHWPGVTLHPARIDDLRAWFEAARTEIDPGDRLFIFVTDHGIVDRVDSNKTAIALWQDRLTVTAFRELLSLLDPGVQVVMLMSQCYSGAFAEAMYPLEAGEPSGNVCGFFSTSGERRAYGCYAEGRDRDKVGHAFQFIEALRRQSRAVDAHAEVLVSDDSPDVPLRTSDLYLGRLVADLAAASGSDVDPFVDGLLDAQARATGIRHAESFEFRAIANKYGLGGFHSVTELAAHDRELEALFKRVSGDNATLRTGLIEVKELLLQAYRREGPNSGALLDAAGAGAGSEETDLARRAASLNALLPSLRQFAESQRHLWDKLTLLQDRLISGTAAAYRLEVRRAALRRLRSNLVVAAGRRLLEGEISPRRQALEALEQCEASPIGFLPSPKSQHH